MQLKIQLFKFVPQIYYHFIVYMLIMINYC